MLPEKFTERMKKLLGSEFPLYLASLDQPRETAFHINTKKCPDISELLTHLPFDCERTEHCSASYYFSAEKPGNHPLHHAGAFYIQEPSAMTPVSCVEGLLPPGIKILDSCASPGGKTSQAVCMTDDSSVIVSNEIVPSRAKTLVGNIERQGFKNTIVMNTDTAQLSALFPEEFALVICDAPCSGEGMFRKSSEAIDEWSEENVSLCAVRQTEILDNVSRCVAPGGYLLYSTCTFSVEENECRVSHFLENHKEFNICMPSDNVVDVTRPGIPEYCCGFDPNAVRRFYPHTARGEGQFFALLRRSGELVANTRFGYKDASRAPNKTEAAAVNDFIGQTVGSICYDIRVHGENIIALPEGMGVPEKRVFSCGVKLGEIRNGRLVPHHQFFSAFGRDFANRIELSSDSCECLKYLRGEGFRYDAPDGWAAVLVDEIPLGGAKMVGGYLKNHYPKGLRIKG